MNSFILKNVRIVDPARNIDEKGDLGIANGVICNPGKVKKPKVLDLAGKIAAPGFIDLHVHLRQPGNTAAETIATGTAAAAAGGFTSIVAMPNTNPAADTPGAIEFLRQMSTRDGVVRVLPCGCMTKGYLGEEMAPIGGLKNAGVVALSDDGRCIQNHALMRNVAVYADSFGLPILDHCEEKTLMGHGVMNESVWSVKLGMNGIPGAAEELIVARDAIFARETGCRIHIQHASVKESVAIVRSARVGGVRISAEATPHHISLTDEWIRKYDTNYKMNPPLRSEADRLALIEGLADGTITVIATDHAPHTKTAKMVEFDVAPFGIVGLETAIPVTLKELYHTKILSPMDYVAKFTTGPAEVLGLTNYSLAEGNAADITVIDPNLRYTIRASEFKSKGRNTPFDGMKVRGRAVLTMVVGKIVFQL